MPWLPDALSPRQQEVLPSSLQLCKSRPADLSLACSRQMQAKYGNPYLQLVWIGSFLAQALRVVLQYRRMFIIFDSFVSKEMFNRTVFLGGTSLSCMTILSMARL